MKSRRPVNSDVMRRSNHGDFRQALLENAFVAQLRLDQLVEFAKIVDSFFKEETERFSTELQGIDDELGWFFAEPFPQILHSSLTVSAVMFLEHELCGITQVLHDALGLHLVLRDLAGSLIDRFRKYVTGVARLSMSLENQLWQDVNGIVELRNCIVHANGDLRVFKRRSSVEQFSARYPQIKISEDYVSLSRDSSVLILGVIRHFLDSIYDSLSKQLSRDA